MDADTPERAPSGRGGRGGGRGRGRTHATGSTHTHTDTHTHGDDGAVPAVGAHDHSNVDTAPSEGSAFRSRGRGFARPAGRSDRHDDRGRGRGRGFGRVGVSGTGSGSGSGRPGAGSGIESEVGGHHDEVDGPALHRADDAAHTYMHAPARAHVDAHGDAAADELEHCVVCAEPLVCPALLPCGHNSVCAMCTAKLRLLARNERCLLCKTVCEHALAISHSSLTQGRDTYDDFGIYGEMCGPDITLDDSSGMFFHDSAAGVLEALRRLRTLTCGCSSSAPKGGKGAKAGAGTCTQTFVTVPELLTHVREGHKMAICELCASNRAVFVNELPRLTPAQLEQHCAKGDAGTGFTGHPRCAFCDKRYYSDSELFSHLTHDHFNCHLCAQRDPRLRHEYYNTYADLERHFRKRHFLCEDRACREKHFIVFDSMLALKTHAMSEHGAPPEDLSQHLMFKFRPVADPRRGRGGRGARGGRAGGDDSAATDTTEADSETSADEEAGAASGGRIRHIHLTEADFPSLRLTGATGAGTGAADDAANDVQIGEETIGGERVMQGPRVVGASGFARAVASGGGANTRSLEDFPALPSSSAGTRDTGRHISGQSFRGAVRRGGQGINAYTSLSALLEWSGQGHVLSGSAARRRVAPAIPPPPLPGFPARAIGDVAPPASRPRPSPAVAVREAPPSSASPASGKQPTHSAASASGSSFFVTQATSALSAVPGGFDQFKTLSAQYRAHEITAPMYHERVVALFDAAEKEFVGTGERPLQLFRRGFQQLIGALPDAESREKLSEMHRAWQAAGAAAAKSSAAKLAPTRAAATVPARPSAAELLAAALNQEGSSEGEGAPAAAPTPAQSQDAPAPPGTAPDMWPDLAPGTRSGGAPVAAKGLRGWSAALHDPSHTRASAGTARAQTGAFASQLGGKSSVQRPASAKPKPAPVSAPAPMPSPSAGDDGEEVEGKPAPSFNDSFAQALAATSLSRGVSKVAAPGGVLLASGAPRALDTKTSKARTRDQDDDGIFRVVVPKGKPARAHDDEHPASAPATAHTEHASSVSASALAAAERRKEKKQRRAKAKGGEDVEDVDGELVEAGDTVTASFADGGFDALGKRAAPRKPAFAPETVAMKQSEQFPAFAPSSASGKPLSKSQAMLAAALGLSEADLARATAPASGMSMVRDEATAANLRRARAKASGKAAAPVYRKAEDLDAMLSGFIKPSAVPAATPAEDDGLAWATGGVRAYQAPSGAAPSARAPADAANGRKKDDADDDLAAMMRGIKVKGRV